VRNTERLLFSNLQDVLFGNY